MGASAQSGFGEVITTYAALLGALSALPPVRDGQVRLFRGQNQHFDRMTPTALRRQTGDDVLWPIYARQLAHDIVGGLADSREVGNDIDVLMLWVDAIKQHYGPGTRFLDVTHSAGIAAWFGLHRLRFARKRSAYGSPGPFDPDIDVMAEHVFARHHRWDHAPAFFYAFDAWQAEGVEGLEHGSAVDLAIAPPPFSSSSRIRAQQACLIYADGGVHGGDLAPLLVPGTPLRIAWPLEGCAELEWPPNKIFPTAAEDDWYARFVSVPLRPHLRQSCEFTIYSHPIDVTLYVPAGSGQREDESLFTDLTSRFVANRPPLIFAHRLRSAAEKGQSTGHPAWEHFADATALLLEGPLMTTLQPLENINSGLIATGLADTAPARDFATGESAGQVSLRNVVIELSPLDATGWERIEHREASATVVRAIWLLRSGKRFFLTFFSLLANVGIATVGPVEVAFDVQSQTFSYRPDPAAEWSPLLGDLMLARVFFTAIGLIRALSPGWKSSPSPQHIITDGESIISTVRLTWAVAEIVSLRTLAPPVNRYCVLRQWGSDDPFYGTVRPDSPALAGVFETKGPPFSRVDAPELLRALGPRLAELTSRPTPLDALQAKPA